jgi:UDP-N-acetylmuramate dehydrogenase
MMKNTEFQDKIITLLPGIQLLTNEPLSKHTSFRIGGPASVMAMPKSPEELKEILKVSALLDCKIAILGAGTNVLASDDGYDGLVICLKDCFAGMEQLDETHIRVSAGVTMTRAALFAAGLGLSGLEFAHGIPGSVGGGVYMNAGAYGGELCQVVQSVDVMDRAGNIRTISNKQMKFSYRHSILEESGDIVLSAVFGLTPAPEAQIREKMQDLMQRRKTSQPLEYPSAGSAFKRPKVGYAAALIDETGLKGYQVGDAAVSKKHAGFVVNLGNATANDVKQLLADVAQKVLDKTGILLEPEVRIW